MKSARPVFISLSLAISQFACCSQAAIRATLHGPPSHSQAKGMHAGRAANIDDEILDLDARVKPVSAGSRALLHKILDDACRRISRLPSKKPGWDPVYAKSVLQTIDQTLVDNGVLYPDTGLVDDFVDVLRPYSMPSARRASFEEQPHNERRVAAINARFPGPFYVADCDVTCYFYLGVADRMQLPIHMVDLPGYDEEAGHDFVRWRDGSNFIDWETMDGVAKDDSFYKSAWGVTDKEIGARAAMVDLTRSELIGYVHSQLGLQNERRGNYVRAVQEQIASLKLYPGNLIAMNNLGWDIAVGASLIHRDHALAVMSVLRNLDFTNDPNVKDTLAAVYASAGMFDLAVQEEQIALEATGSETYKERLQEYKNNKAHRELHAEVRPGEIFTP